jgi:hypothetical protein
VASCSIVFSDEGEDDIGAFVVDPDRFVQQRPRIAGLRLMKRAVSKRRRSRARAASSRRRERSRVEREMEIAARVRKRKHRLRMDAADSADLIGVLSIPDRLPPLGWRFFRGTLAPKRETLPAFAAVSTQVFRVRESRPCE